MYYLLLLIICRQEAIKEEELTKEVESYKREVAQALVAPVVVSETSNFWCINEDRFSSFNLAHLPETSSYFANDGRVVVDFSQWCVWNFIFLYFH